MSGESTAAKLHIVAVQDDERHREIDRLKACLDGTGAIMHQLHIPKLKVGTLDELMLMGDELVKLDAEAENIGCKIQRKYDDLVRDEVGARQLGVKGVEPRKFWEHFSWNEASYPANRKLPQIAAMIGSHVKAADTNFSHGITVHQEARNKLTALQRKAGGNLLVADLHDVLTECGVDIPKMFEDREFTKCVLVVVQSSDAKRFLETYGEIDSSACTLFAEGDTPYSRPTDVPTEAPMRIFSVCTEAGRVLEAELGTGMSSPSVWQLKSAIAKAHNLVYDYIQFFFEDRFLGDRETLDSAGVPAEAQLKLVFESPSQNRNRVAAAHLSPAIAGTAELIKRDPDGYSLFALRVMRGRGDALLNSFKLNCQKLRFTVREYSPPKVGSAPAQSLKKQLGELVAKEKDAKVALLKRCPGYFTTVYIALAHIKAIRVFAEAVLRFGVPPNFVSVIVDYQGQEKLKARSERVLGKTYNNYDVLGIAGSSVSDKASQAELNLLGKSQQEFYPYVYIPIESMDSDHSS